MLKQTSEFTILLIVEQCFQLIREGNDLSLAVRRLNQLHSDRLSTAGISLPTMGPPYTLERYVRHYADSTHAFGEMMSDEFIVSAIDMIDYFYSCDAAAFQ